MAADTAILIWSDLALQQALKTSEVQEPQARALCQISMFLFSGGPLGCSSYSHFDTQMWSPPLLHIFASFCHPDAFYSHTLTLIWSPPLLHIYASFCHQDAFYSHTLPLKCDLRHRYTFLLAFVIQMLFICRLWHSMWSPPFLDMVLLAFANILLFMRTPGQSNVTLTAATRFC